jgi:hypothetical protein
MARVKRSVHAKKKRREVLAAAKGYTGSRRIRYRIAKEQVRHSGMYAYRIAATERVSSGASGSRGSTRRYARTACRTRASSMG